MQVSCLGFSFALLFSFSFALILNFTLLEKYGDTFIFFFGGMDYPSIQSDIPLKFLVRLTIVTFKSTSMKLTAKKAMFMVWCKGE